jgi:Ca2+-binding EF-hand superfamily protein
LSNHKVIRFVNAEAASMKSQYWKVVIASIKREVISHMIHEAVRSDTLGDLAVRFEHFSEGQKAYYLHCFEAYDISGNGGLDAKELVKCLTEILPSDGNSPVRKRMSVAATEDEEFDQTQNETEQITSDAEEWFRIFGIQSDGSLELEAFQALVVCITQSSHGMLSENDILPVLTRHAGINTNENTSCGVKELETLLHSISGVKPFKHAGVVILEEIRRSEGTTLKREGTGWKSVVHQMRKELPVSLLAVAKYVVRLDVQAQAATGRLRRAIQYEKKRKSVIGSPPPSLPVSPVKDD